MVAIYRCGSNTSLLHFQNRYEQLFHFLLHTYWSTKNISHINSTTYTKWQQNSSSLNQMHCRPLHCTWKLNKTTKFIATRNKEESSQPQRSAANSTMGMDIFKLFVFEAQDSDIISSYWWRIWKSEVELSTRTHIWILGTMHALPTSLLASTKNGHILGNILVTLPPSSLMHCRNKKVPG
jgi:hypothetical protein